MEQLVQRFVFAPTSEEIGFLVKDGKEYINCFDVARALHVKDSNRITRGLDKDEYIVLNTSDLKLDPPQFGVSSWGGARQITFLTESGFYHAMLTSRKPEAKPFRRWVTDEVLPSIRKHGYYTLESKVREMQEALDEKDEELMSLDDQLATTQSRLKWEMEQVRKLQDTIGTYAPFTDMPKGGHARRGSNVNPYHTADAPKTDGSAYRRAIRRSLKCGVIDDYMLDRFRLVVEADLIKGTKHTKDEQRVLELLALGHMKVQTTLSL